MNRANAIDRKVGQRLRARRRQLGLTQVDLAEAIGLTFQQIQKYERGANRISASRLHGFCRVLKVAPAYFFEDEPNADDCLVHDDLYEQVKDEECRRLNEAFLRIASPSVRRALVAFIQAVGEGMHTPV